MPVCSPSTRSCSWAAGRRVSREAINGFLRSRVLQAVGDLCGRGRLAGTLQADHQDRHGRYGVEIDRVGIGTEHGDEFVVDELDDHLAGRHRFQDFAADSLFPDLVDERLDDVQRHVGFKQRAADFAHGFRDVGLA